MLNWRLLIADYSRELPTDDELLREWAYLDTFDMLSPRFDFPQTKETARRWCHEAGLADVEVSYGYNGIEICVKETRTPSTRRLSAVTFLRDCGSGYRLTGPVAAPVQPAAEAVIRGPVNVNGERQEARRVAVDDENGRRRSAR